jgi:hypothetical protein
MAALISYVILVEYRNEIVGQLTTVFSAVLTKLYCVCVPRYEGIDTQYALMKWCRSLSLVRFLFPKEKRGRIGPLCCHVLITRRGINNWIY